MIGHSCEDRWNLNKILIDRKILFTVSPSRFGKRAYDIGNIIVLWWINYYLIRQECENEFPTHIFEHETGLRGKFLKDLCQGLSPYKWYTDMREG